MKLKSIFIKIGLLIMLFIPLTVWSMGKKEKIDICHKGTIINVSKNALKAHKGHGDFVIESDDDNKCSETDDDQDDQDDDSNSDTPVLNLSELDQAILVNDKLYIPQLEVDVFGGKRIFSVVLAFDVLNFGFIVEKIEEVSDPRDDFENAVFSNNRVNLTFFYDPAQITINADLELISSNFLVVTDFIVVDDNSGTDTDTDTEETSDTSPS